MKITQNTPDTLVINCREWGGVVFFSVLFLGSIWVLLLLPGQDAPVWTWLVVGVWPVILGLITVMSPRRSQMVLDRASGRLELRRKHGFGYRSRWFELAHIDGFYPSLRFNIVSAIQPATRRAFVNLRVSGGMDPGDFSLNTYGAWILRVKAVSETANEWLAQ